MSILARLTGHKANRRVFVLGLDGVPHSFLLKAVSEGLMPAMGRLMAGGTLAPMTSVIPTVSSVAWASYMTGNNPGRHGIYGFVDRQAGSYDVFVPTAVNLNGPTLWDAVGRSGRKVIVVNVPMTYPPRPLNGILVSDFLCTSMDKVAYPPEISIWLREIGYRIDADAKLARTAPEDFKREVMEVLEKRFLAAFGLMERHPWDFFQLHVMETDRVNHFLLPRGQDDPANSFFNMFYKRLDELISALLALIPEGALLVALSDHGFCPLKKEVYLNQILVELGFLSLPPGAGLARLENESRAYSLIPGRVYLNLAGREPRGSVSPADYEPLRREITAALAGIRDPDDGAPVVRRVARGEELYRGGRPSFPVMGAGAAPVPPDLVVIPHDGYDLKGSVGKGRFGNTELVGMHTYDDAFLFVRGKSGPFAAAPNITDVFPSVAAAMGIPLTESVDGRDLAFN